PAAAAGASGIVGIARGLRERSEWRDSGAHYMVTFRVERHDAYGAPLAPVPVELVGRRIEGVIQDGDWVEVPPHWQPGETLRTTTVRNLTTGAEFRARGYSKAIRVVQWVFFAIVIAFILAVAISIAISVLSDDGFPDVPELPSVLSL
ncbi:MAG: hypothetical protein M3389_16080, partial [Actinomycetota bacterium]|nr:hypothetical protein [Actinomycetota bacterium]